jgi:hypothetical protein
VDPDISVIVAHGVLVPMLEVERQARRVRARGAMTADLDAIDALRVLLESADLVTDVLLDMLRFGSDGLLDHLEALR